ncbi:MAG: response regulator [Anaerolineae bacterium]|nr:response regulator [Gloeobacterales cyanobacterium ES-bin-313]
MRILLAEDDIALAELLEAQLSEKRHGHFVDVATDGEAAWELAQMLTYDLVISHVPLPKLDGIGLCRKLRSRGHQMPILLMTARANCNDKVLGLDAGADDYILKPFDFEELAARVRALLRRGNSACSPLLIWGELHLDLNSCLVHYGVLPLHLTPKEYGLLELFLRHPKRMFSRSEILDHLWEIEDPPEEETVKAHIKGLRQKLKRSGAPADFIETVYGLGYRLKPLAEVAYKKQRTEVALSESWERLREKILGRVTTLEQATIAWLEGSIGEELRQQAYQEANKLAGSLGIFGFIEGARLAQDIQSQLRSELRVSDPGQVLHLSQLVVALHRELQMASPMPLVAANHGKTYTKLLIIATDVALIQELISIATMQDLSTQVVESADAAREAIADQRPDAVLLDLSLSETHGLKLLAELAAQTSPIPVLVFAVKDGLADRVTVARLGGRAFLHKPLAVGESATAIDQLLAQVEVSKSRILAVDDDPQVLAMLKQVLEPWGFKLRTLEDPRLFWEVFQGFSPDLLILNAEMPHFSGLELCQVIRNDLQWSALPIVFLTAHTDPEMTRRVFCSGGDDYISKPIGGPELVTCLLNRLERTWLLRNIARNDPLTKTFNRRHFLQELEQFLHLARHYDQPLCLVLIKVDGFKELNRQQGSTVGDQVLRQVGSLLLNTFQGIDIVGRWGSARFVLAMYGLTRQEGYERLVEAMENLRKEGFLGCDGKALKITCSSGLVLCAEDGDQLPVLCHAVEQALESGRSTALRNRQEAL